MCMQRWSSSGATQVYTAINSFNGCECKAALSRGNVPEFRRLRCLNRSHMLARTLSNIYWHNFVKCWRHKHIWDYCNKACKLKASMLVNRSQGSSQLRFFFFYAATGSFTPAWHFDLRYCTAMITSSI